MTAAQAASAGLRSTDPRTLQLYADGRQVPIEVFSDDVGHWSRTEFYGTGLDTPTTDTHVYWLLAGRQAGARMPLVGSRPEAGAGPPYFMSTVTRRERILYLSTLLTHGGNNWFGRPLTTEPLDIAIAAPDVDSSGAAATLTVAIQGVSGQDQRVGVRLNGINVGQLTVSGTNHVVARFRIPPSRLQAGNDALELVLSGPTGAASLFDYVRLTYPRLYRVEHGALHFTAPAGAVVDLSGLSPGAGVRVIDLTDSGSPVTLATYPVSGSSETAATVTVPRTPARTHSLFAFTPAAELAPAQIQLHRPTSLHAPSNGADLLVIAPAALQPAVDPLVQLRRRQGLKVKVIDIQSIIDEFGYGTHGPGPLRAFLAWASGHWRRKPRYVMLVGTASTDPRNYARGGATELVPTKMLDATSAEAPSDDWLVDFKGDGLPGMAIGRLPARTPAELQVMVQKIVGWAPSHTQSSALLVSGASLPDDEVDFSSASAGLAALFPAGTSLAQVTAPGGSPSDATDQIIAGINAGPRFVNYLGHGSLDVWDGLLETEDLGELSNGSHLPIFVMPASPNGYFVSPATQSLGEELLADASGGAVATLTSTGEASLKSEVDLNIHFYQRLFSHPGARLGDVIRDALPAVSDSVLRHTWVLLGDPTMTVWP